MLDMVGSDAMLFVTFNFLYMSRVVGIGLDVVYYCMLFPVLLNIGYLLVYTYIYLPLSPRQIRMQFMFSHPQTKHRPKYTQSHQRQEHSAERIHVRPEDSRSPACREFINLVETVPDARNQVCCILAIAEPRPQAGLQHVLEHA